MFRAPAYVYQATEIRVITLPCGPQRRISGLMKAICASGRSVLGPDGEAEGTKLRSKGAAPPRHSACGDHLSKSRQVVGTQCKGKHSAEEYQSFVAGSWPSLPRSRRPRVDRLAAPENGDTDLRQVVFAARLVLGTVRGRDRFRRSSRGMRFEKTHHSSRGAFARQLTIPDRLNWGESHAAPRHGGCASRTAAHDTATTNSGG